MRLALMYHDVVEDGDFLSSGFPNATANLYKMRSEDFERHLEAIHRDVPPEAVGKVGGRRDLNSAARVFFTFDDGGCSALHPTAHLLERYGWRGHFFITTDRIGTAGFLSGAGIRELRGRGHVIGSHSCSHPPRMSAISPAAIEREWRDSLARLSELLGEPVTVASVPGGYYSRAVGTAAAKAGIEVLFYSEPTATVSAVDGCLLIGRYVAVRDTTPEQAAGIAAGRLGPRWKQSALWKAKAVVKAVGGSTYLKLRQSILDR